MEFKFYKCKDDIRKVDKNFTDEVTLQGSFRGVYDKENPTIETEFDITPYNYFEIDGEMYYFSAEAIRPMTDFYIVKGTKDVLYNNRNEIRQLKCTVKRNEFNSNAYLVDDRYKALSYKKVVTKTFPNGLTDDNIVLLTVGG